MAIIHTGERWDISRGERFVHKGTMDYLKAIGAEIVPDTEEEVDASDIDGQGKYMPRRSDR
jgi:hypothetical protein